MYPYNKIIFHHFLAFLDVDLFLGATFLVTAAFLATGLEADLFGVVALATGATLLTGAALLVGATLLAGAALLVIFLVAFAGAALLTGALLDYLPAICNYYLYYKILL